MSDTEIEKAKASLTEARRLLDQAEYTKSREACARALAMLGTEGQELLRAQAVLLDALANVDSIPDLERLAWAGDVLAGAGSWEEALDAYGMAAHIAGQRRDTPGERRLLTRALGCADAGGSRVIAPNLIRKLALVELREGNPQRAGELATIAFEKLDGVLLLSARWAEAECLETIGDARAAQGDRALAETCWRDAMARFERLERTKQVEAIRAKLGHEVMIISPDGRLRIEQLRVSSRTDRYDDDERWEIRVVDRETGAVLATASYFENYSIQTGSRTSSKPKSIAFSADSKTLELIDEDGDIRRIPIPRKD